MTTINTQNSTKRISFIDAGKEATFGFQKNWKHELITGLVLDAYAYRYPMSDKKKYPNGMLGIIHVVQVEAPNPDNTEGAFIVRVNHPMNKLDAHVRKFKELINNDPRIRIEERDHVVIEERIGKGIKAFVRDVSTKFGRIEYQVNEYYGIDFEDEPTYMEDLPDVPNANEYEKACSDNELPPKRDWGSYDD